MSGPAVLICANIRLYLLAFVRVLPFLLLIALKKSYAECCSDNRQKPRKNYWEASVERIGQSLGKCGKSLGRAWKSPIGLWEKCVHSVAKSEESAAEER